MKKGSILGLLAGLFSIGFVSASWSFADLLNQLNDFAFFDYILPFLLVFALVYAILTKSNILGNAENKNLGAVLIISLAIGMLSLFSPFPQFIKQMTPNLAIGLSFLLAAIILLGLWANETDKRGTTIKWIFVIVGIAAFIFVLINSFSAGYWGIDNIWNDYGPAIITLAIIVGIIALVVKWNK
jgi:hypothetical protein